MPKSGSSYKIGLGPKIIFKARIIFGSLFLICVALLALGIYQGIQSGDFNKILIQPFKQFLKGSETPAETPSPSLLPAVTPTPTATPLPVKKSQPQVQYTQPVVSNCIRKNIREGEFASNKCYSQQDFEDLQYYLQQYDSAVFSRDGAESSMKITCNCRVQQECDFFKDSCEKDKQQKSTAEANISKYKGIILGIIAKGQ